MIEQPARSHRGLAGYATDAAASASLAAGALGGQHLRVAGVAPSTIDDFLAIPEHERSTS